MYGWYCFKSILAYCLHNICNFRYNALLLRIQCHIFKNKILQFLHKEFLAIFQRFISLQLVFAEGTAIVTLFFKEASATIIIPMIFAGISVLISLQITLFLVGRLFEKSNNPTGYLQSGIQLSK